MGAFASVLYQDHLRRQARAETFKSFREEAKLNREYAVHNARAIRTSAFIPLFIPFRITACERLLLSGAFKIDDETRKIGSVYLRGLDDVNSMMRAVETFTIGRNAGNIVKAIQGYCSGELDPMLDAGATSIPESIAKLLSHLESKYAKELGETQSQREPPGLAKPGNS